jgi:WD40 repeat protein
MKLVWRTRPYGAGIMHVGILNERYGLSVTSRGNLRTWTLDGGAPSLAINIGTGVGSVAQRGESVLTDCDHGTIHLWKIASPEIVRSPRGHAGSEQSLVAAPAADYAMTGGPDGTVCIWNSRSGRRETMIKLHEDIVSAVVTSADASLIASAGWDGWLSVVRREGETPLRMHAHQGWIQALCFNEELDLAVSTAHDGKAVFWELSKANILAVHEAPGERGSSAALFGGIAAVGYDTGAVRFWDLPSQTLLRTLRPSNEVVRGIHFDPTGRRVAVESPGMLVILDVEGAEIIQRRARVRFITWSPNGRHYFTASEGGEFLHAYGIVKRKCVWSLRASGGDQFSGEGCWIPRSRTLAVVGNRRLHVLDRDAGRILATWHADGHICGPVVSRRGDLLVCDPRGELRLLKVTRRTP